MKPTDTTPQPHASPQGVGVVLQLVGAAQFAAFFLVCCISALLSKDTAAAGQLTSIGWGRYTAQRAIAVCLLVGILLGLALTVLGFGVQMRRRRAMTFAVFCALAGTALWLVHALFFAQALRSITLTLFAALASFVYVALSILLLGAWQVDCSEISSALPKGETHAAMHAVGADLPGRMPDRAGSEPATGKSPGADRQGA